jgi:ribokinase
MTTAGRVCVVGSANVDLVVAVTRLPEPGETVLGDRYREYPGGKGFNQAVAGRRAGAETTLCACVGDDDAGRFLRATMGAAGIDGGHVAEIAGAATGRALIAATAEQNMIIVAPGANARLTTEAAIQSARDAQVVLAQLEVPIRVVTETFRMARQRGAVTILNPAPAARLPQELLGLCDFVIPHEHEARTLGGAGALLAAGAGQIIVTQGARGSVRSSRDHPDRTVPAFAVDVVDTTGAGDAFCGAFAAAIARGTDEHAAMRFASAAGSLATTRAGAVPSIPLRAEIETLAATGQTRP